MILGCSAPPDATDESASVSRQALSGPSKFCDSTTNKCTVVLTAPMEVPLRELAINASTVARVNDRARVVAFDDVTTPVVAGLGTPTGCTNPYNCGTTNRLGVGATLGHLFATAPVELADRSTVMGSLIYASTLARGNDVRIVGSAMTTPKIATWSTPLLSVQWPNDYSANLPTIENGSNVTREAGGYFPQIVIRGNASLTLKPSDAAYTDYFTDNLTVEGKLVIDTSNNRKVRLFVNGNASVILNGQVVEDQGAGLDVTKSAVRDAIVYLGDGPISVND